MTGERAVAGVACGAHARHDGYTDLIYVMRPVWQAELSLGDALGVPATLVVIAAIVLTTLPLALALKPALTPRA